LVRVVSVRQDAGMAFRLEHGPELGEEAQVVRTSRGEHLARGSDPLLIVPDRADATTTRASGRRRGDDRSVWRVRRPAREIRTAVQYGVDGTSARWRRPRSAMVGGVAGRRGLGGADRIYLRAISEWSPSCNMRITHAGASSLRSTSWAEADGGMDHARAPAAALYPPTGSRARRHGPARTRRARSGRGARTVREAAVSVG